MPRTHAHPTTPRYARIRRAAAIFGLPDSRIRLAVHDGRLKLYKIDQEAHGLICLDELEELIRKSASSQAGR